MKYRWKLLFLLLAISILPVVGLRTFGIHNVHIMADALTAQVEQKQITAAKNRIRTVVNTYTRDLRAIREQIQMALFFQAFEIKQHLQMNERSGLDDLVPVYRAVAQLLGGLVLRQHTGLENGAHTVFPAINAPDADAAWRHQPWYRSAFEENLTLWSRPYTDPETGQIVMAASLALESETDVIWGVTSLIVPLSSLMEPFLSDTSLPADTRIFLCTLSLKPEEGHAGAKILMHSHRKDGNDFWTDTHPSDPWLASSDESGLAHMLLDFTTRNIAVREMPYAERESFWAYGPLLHHGSAFVIVIPRDSFIGPSDPIRHSIKTRQRQVELLTAGFLVVLVLTATLLALAFSRTVTRPLEALSLAARRLASGSFDTRVDIRTGDEFENMARIFNTVGPQLKAHYQVRRSLEVAMEIQQNLLPDTAPDIPGLDICGMTLYSDETGGDYYDYLCTDEKQRQRFCVAVGDVSGHGIPSALLMATARALLRFRADAPGSLADMVSDVNRAFAEDVEASGGFMTLFLLRIDRQQNRLRWVRAGHEPALLYCPAEDSFQRLEGRGGLAVGVMAAAQYHENACDIRPGQIVCLGTDGIWETRNPAGAFFGKQRLYDAIRRYAGESAQTILLSIFDAVAEFRETSDQEDDLTMVVVKTTADDPD